MYVYLVIYIYICMYTHVYDQPMLPTCSLNNPPCPKVSKPLRSAEAMRRNKAVDVPVTLGNDCYIASEHGL